MNKRRYHHVLITGGAGGIGKALALRFLEERYRVVIVDCRSDILERIQQQVPSIQTVMLDINDVEALKDLALRLGASPDGPDIIINNAGVHRYGNLDDSDCELAEKLTDIDREIRTNFTSLVQNCALWIPYLHSRPNGAAIVNISSALAFVPQQSSAIYCATKAAVQQFSTILALQLANSRIRVVTAYPPMVDTQMTVGRDARRMMSPERFAQLFYKKFCRGKHTIRIGESRWLYWLHRLSPTLATYCIEP